MPKALNPKFRTKRMCSFCGWPAELIGHYYETHDGLIAYEEETVLHPVKPSHPMALRRADTVQVESHPGVWQDKELVSWNIEYTHICTRQAFQPPMNGKEFDDQFDESECPMLAHERTEPWPSDEMPFECYLQHVEETVRAEIRERLAELKPESEPTPPPEVPKAPAESESPPDIGPIPF